jgi:hypothetical protein
MSEWEVSTDVREITLLDSQDMDYSVKLQKDKQDCDCQKTIALAGAYCNEIQLNPCWQNVKEGSVVLGLFLFLE